MASVAWNIATALPKFVLLYPKLIALLGCQAFIQLISLKGPLLDKILDLLSDMVLMVILLVLGNGFLNFHVGLHQER